MARTNVPAAMHRPPEPAETVSAAKRHAARVRLQGKSGEPGTLGHDERAATEDAGNPHQQLQLYDAELMRLNHSLGTKIEELRAANDDLTHALISTGIAAVFLDTLMHIRRFTPPCTDILLLSDSDIGRPLSEIGHVFGPVDLHQLALGMLRERESASREIRTKSGTWYSVRATAYRGHERGADGAVVTFTDVTSIKESEERFRRLVESMVVVRTKQLSMANERLQAEVAEHMRTQHELAKRHHALESLHMLATSVEGTLETLFSEICKRLAMALDVSFVTVAGFESNCLNPVTQYVDGDIRQLVSLRPDAHVCARTIYEEGVHQFCGYLDHHYPACPELPTTEPISYLGVPIRDQGSRLRGAVCVVCCKPRIYSDEDAHVVELFARYAAHEITRERLERQLRQAQEMKMLGQLTSGVAHEVRNPLNAIQAVTEALVLELGDADAFRPFVGHINSNVRRLTDLMRDLLELGRTRHQLSFRRIGLGELVDQAVHDWLESSPHRERRLNVHGEETARRIRVHADAVKVRQVFANLFDNACYHSPEDSAIDIYLEELVERWASVAIIDHGSGIPEKLVSRVLDPFFTTRKGGTGLGLSIVRHIMDMHEGTVSIANNEPAPGVTARVAFPIE